MPPNAASRPLALLGPRTLAPLGAGSSARGTLEWDTEALAYVFAVEEVSYRVLLAPPENEESQPGLLRIEGRIGSGEWRQLLREAGMLSRDVDGTVHSPGETHRRCAFLEMRHSLRGRVLALRYEELIEGNAVRRSLQIKLSGRSLEVEVDAPGGQPGAGFCGFSLGPVGPDGAPQLAVPGLPQPLLRVDGGYLLAYADRLLGRASAYTGSDALYRPQEDGVTQPVSETYYLTLSPDPLAALPALRHGPAPFRDELISRVTLDYYSTQAYEDDERLFRLLPLYGLRDVFLIYRNWQHTGYNRRNPLLYPAAEERGGNDTFRRMLAAAAESGWRVALRQEYFAAAHESPYWTPVVLATDAEGNPRPSCREGSDAIAADRMLEFARLEATKIARNYPVNATFVDCHTAWDPEAHLHQVSDRGGSAGNVMQTQRCVEALLAFLRDAHDGPVVGSAGEGAHRFDTLNAGVAEGVIRGVDGGQSAPLIVDYELQEVRDRLVGIGCGSYRQFAGHPELEPVDAARIDWDAYRATEIALGHAGYAGNYRIKPGPRGIPFPAGSASSLVREYFLLRYLQQLYLNAPVRTVRYRSGDRLLDLIEALHTGLDLSQAQIRVEYEPDLTVWVNRSATERWTVTLNDERFELPPSGFLAYSAEERFIAYSVLVNSNRVDYCECPLYTFVDTRGPNPRLVETISTDGAAVFMPGALARLQDVVLVGARQAITGEDEYRLSDRGDARFTWHSETEIELTVLDTETGKPTHVTFPAPTPEWHQHREVMEYAEGAWQVSRTQAHTVRQGIQLARALPGVTYRIRARG